MGDRGRTASYPAAPSQTPPCGITATGSSGLFAWVLHYPLFSAVRFVIMGDVACFTSLRL